jgi:preprotein translocase subunit YajC
MFATPAMAQTATGGAAPEGIAALIAGPLPMIVMIFVLFYFLMIRPQQKRAKEHTTMLGALKRGDVVVLQSGIVGKITKVDDTEASVEIAPTVNVKVVKTMILEVRTRSEPAPANDAKS